MIENNLSKRALETKYVTCSSRTWVNSLTFLRYPDKWQGDLLESWGLIVEQWRIFRVRQSTSGGGFLPPCCSKVLWQTIDGEHHETQNMSYPESKLPITMESGGRKIYFFFLFSTKWMTMRLVNSDHKDILSFQVPLSFFFLSIYLF